MTPECICQLLNANFAQLCELQHERVSLRCYTHELIYSIHWEHGYGGGFGY